MFRFALAVALCAAVGCGHHSGVGPTGGGDTGGHDGGGPNGGGDGGNEIPDGGPDAPPSTACSPSDPRSGVLEITAQPDSGEAPFVDVINTATKTIDVFIYEMGYGGILDAFKAKAAAGVTVRVILDQKPPSNQNYYNLMTAAGIQVHWSDPQFTYMHAKVILIDRREALVSTGNFSLKYSIQLERNFLAHITDPSDVGSLSALFEADWAQMSPDLSCTRMIVAPANARDRLLDFITSAQTTLTIESMQFGDPDVRQRVADRKKAGVDVRAILADPSWITANTDAANFLKGLGIPVKHIPHCHVKALTVDGKAAYMGSENFSYTSLSKNREVGLLIYDANAMKPILDTFEKDWASGTNF